jgi:MFS superfamily sulfate permease-like transporter/carbonic anhydrase/acetyltransferase-like protein (isoleucine patch superfamily)
MLKRLKLFLNPFDGRFEDLRKGDWRLNVVKDFTAGLIVAMIAIPLAMGFAMASGLRPEQGIIGGAVAGLVGALFSGSKYQVYGPTAAFIPVIAGIMLEHDHAYLVLVSAIAAVILSLMGLFKLGKLVNLVPHSIVVGFTIGIAATIALSQVGEIFGLKPKLGYAFLDKVRGIAEHFGDLNLWALALAVGTLLITKLILRISVFLPAPLLSLAFGATLTATVLKEQDLALIGTKYGTIPARSWDFTPPDLGALSWANAADLGYAVLAIVFVAAIESLLCSRLADRLAKNSGLPYNPDKELFAQGLVMGLIPLLNGFPHTGALARTATNIKLGAVSPLAGIFKFALKLFIAFYLASSLEQVPMACIAGILLYGAMNMVKGEEIAEVKTHGRAHVALMVYTAVAVVVTDFLTGVLTALALFAVGSLLARTRSTSHAQKAALELEPHHGVIVSAEGHVGLGGALEPGMRARLPDHAAHLHVHKDDLAPAEKGPWLRHVAQRPFLARSAFVHPKAAVIGRVVVREHVHIAAGASVRADEGAPFYIGASSNVQDGAVIHALKERFVTVGGEDWAVYIGRNVSLAHDALVHGPCYIGDGSFVGFKATVHDSIIGRGCFIGIGAIVVGVEVPDRRFVPHGAIIDSAEKAQALGMATEVHHEFNLDVVDVNRGLAAAYREHHWTGNEAQSQHEIAAPDDVPLGWQRVKAAVF